MVSIYTIYNDYVILVKTPLNPSDYCMYRQFNPKNLHFVHTVISQVPHDSLPYTEPTKWSLEWKHTVFCEVRPESLHTMQNNFSLQRVKFKTFSGFKRIRHCCKLLPLRKHSASITKAWSLLQYSPLFRAPHKSQKYILRAKYVMFKC